jgi:plastocyanin
MGGEDIPEPRPRVGSTNPPPVRGAYGPVNRSEEGEMLRTRLLRFVSATALIVVGIALPSGVVAANTGVDIAGFAFAPRSVTVHVGDTVTWANSDARSHTATADDGSFDTGPITNGASKSVTFSTAGTFAYHCAIHPTMTATVIVEAATLPRTDTATASAASGATPVALLLTLVFAAAAIVADLRLAAGRSRPGAPTTEAIGG